MRIFIGFAEAQREIAEDLATSLRTQRHEVMLDDDDYPPGPTPAERQRAAVEAATRFIFLVSPESIAKGSVALAALSTARRKWPSPKEHVLAVIAAPVTELPEYLRTSTVFDPPGSLVPEVVNAIHYSSRSAVRRYGKIAAIASGGVAAIVVAVYVGNYWGRSSAPTEGASGQALFEIRASPDFLTMGGEGKYELVNSQPSAVPEYRCEIAWEKGRNIDSLEHDDKCTNIRVRAVARPFLDRSGTPYTEGQYDPEAEGVELTVIDDDGKAVWRSLVPIGLMNTRLGLEVTGPAVRPDDSRLGMTRVALDVGAPAEFTVGIAGTPLPSDYQCSLRSDMTVQSVRVESEPGSCRMRLAVHEGSVPRILMIDVKHTSGWKSELILRVESSRRRKSRDTNDDLTGRSADASASPGASVLARMTQFCGHRLFCDLELRALGGTVREIRMGASPDSLDYTIPGKALASRSPGDPSRIFFPAAVPEVHLLAVLEDGREIGPARIRVSNPQAASAMPMTRLHGAGSVQAYWLGGTRFYLFTHAPITRAWFDSDGSGFRDAALSRDRNLVTLPGNLGDLVRFRLDLSTGERLDGLEFKVERGP